MRKNTTKLRVGFVVDDGLDRPDGVQQYVLTLGEWLRTQGHYICYLAGETKRSDISNVISVSKNLKVRFNRNKLSSPLPVSLSKIRKILSEQRLDVIHVQVPYSPFMAAKIVKAASPNTRIIGTFHVLPYGKLQYHSTKALGYALKRNLRKFDKFISVSPPAQQFAQKSFDIKSEIIPNPVDIKKYNSSPKWAKDGYFNIVFLGRLVHRKGCMKLLMAMNVLLQRDGLPSIKLHICGDGPERQGLENYVDKTALREIVEFHGFVSEKDKAGYLSSADLAVFPSMGGESFGIVLLEAMAAGGGVVLASNNSGYASVMNSLEECLFDPNDADGFSEKIYGLIKDGKKQKLLHKHQQELVRRFDINIVGADILKVYKD